MKEYPKINTIYKRKDKSQALILNKYSTQEIEYLKDNEWILTEKETRNELQKLVERLNTKKTIKEGKWLKKRQE